MKYKMLALLLFLSFCIAYGSDVKPLELKDSGTAIGVSVAATLLPSIPFLVCGGTNNANFPLEAGTFILSLAGFIVGPSAGHFYARNNKRGKQSMGVRTGFALLGATGLAIGFANLIHEDFGAARGGAAIAIASGICILGSAVYDMSTCPQSVEKYNQSIRDQGYLYLSPEIDIKKERYGLSLSYGF